MYGTGCFFSHKQTPPAGSRGICLEMWVCMFNKTITPSKHRVQFMSHVANDASAPSIRKSFLNWCLCRAFIYQTNISVREGERELYVRVGVGVSICARMKGQRRTLSVQLYHCLLYFLETDKSLIKPGTKPISLSDPPVSNLPLPPELRL